MNIKPATPDFISEYLTEREPCPEGEEWHIDGCRPTYETLMKMFERDKKDYEILYSEYREEYKLLKSREYTKNIEIEKMKKELEDLRGFKNTILSGDGPIGWNFDH